MTRSPCGAVVEFCVRRGAHPFLGHLHAGAAPAARGEGGARAIPIRVSRPARRRRARFSFRHRSLQATHCTLHTHTAHPHYTHTIHRTLPARCLWRHYALHCTPQGCRSLAAGSTRPSTRALPRQPRSGTRHRRRRWRARCSLSRAGTGRRASPPPSRTARKSRLGVPPAAGAGCAQGRERWGWGPGNPVPRVLEDLVRSFLRSRYTGVRSCPWTLHKSNISFNTRT